MIAVRTAWSLPERLPVRIESRIARVEMSARASRLGVLFTSGQLALTVRMVISFALSVFINGTYHNVPSLEVSVLSP